MVTGGSGIGLFVTANVADVTVLFISVTSAYVSLVEILVPTSVVVNLSSSAVVVGYGINGPKCGLTEVDSLLFQSRCF